MTSGQGEDLIASNQDATLPLQVLLEREYLSEWRKHRQRQTNTAIEIIGPEPEQRDACREDVERMGMLNAVAIGWLHAKDKSKTKEGKGAAGRLARVLRRLMVVLKDEDLDPTLAGAAVTRHMSPGQILDAAKYCEQVETTRTGKLDRKDALAKRQAVQVAHDLLMKYNRAEAGDTTKGSAFCRLAALLYGKPEADLHHQCLAARREKRGSK
jgi:hypothetical protein